MNRTSKPQAAPNAIYAVLQAVNKELTRLRAARDLLLADDTTQGTTGPTLRAHRAKPKRFASARRSVPRAAKFRPRKRLSATTPA